MTQQEQPEALGAKTLRRIGTSTAARAAGGRWAVWLLRALVWAVLVGAALLLIRQVAAPSATEVVDAALDEHLATDARDWPTDEARDVATRLVADALTLVENDRALDVEAADQPAAAAAITPAAGAGQVTQTVETITPGRVEVTDARRATVYLSARVETVADPGDEHDGPETFRRWRWLAVPVVYDGAQVVAADGIVEVPPAAEVTVNSQRRQNLSSSWAAETEELADALFAAMAGDSRTALDALTDGSIALLSDDIQLEEVAAWRVAEPDSRGVTAATRTLIGEADVVWTHPGGVTATQTYTVQLERTSDNRWQITEVGPTHPYREEE